MRERERKREREREMWRGERSSGKFNRNLDQVLCLFKYTCMCLYGSSGTITIAPKHLRHIQQPCGCGQTTRSVRYVLVASLAGLAGVLVTLSSKPCISVMTLN